MGSSTRSTRHSVRGQSPEKPSAAVQILDPVRSRKRARTEVEPEENVKRSIPKAAPALIRERSSSISGTRPVRNRPVDVDKKICSYFADDSFSALEERAQNGWGILARIRLEERAEAFDTLRQCVLDGEDPQQARLTRRTIAIASAAKGRSAKSAVYIPSYTLLNEEADTDAPMGPWKGQWRGEQIRGDDYDGDSEDEEFVTGINKRYAIQARGPVLLKRLHVESSGHSKVHNTRPPRTNVVEEEEEHGKKSKKNGKGKGRVSAAGVPLLTMSTLERLVERLEREHFNIEQDRALHDEGLRLVREHCDAHDHLEHLFTRRSNIDTSSSTAVDVQLPKKVSVRVETETIHVRRARGRPRKPQLVTVPEESESDSTSSHKSHGSLDGNFRSSQGATASTEDEGGSSSADKVHSDVMSEDHVIKLLRPVLLVSDSGAAWRAYVGDAPKSNSSRSDGQTSDAESVLSQMLVEVLCHWRKKREASEGPLLRCYHTFEYMENWQQSWHLASVSSSNNIGQSHGVEREREKDGDGETTRAGQEALEAYTELKRLRQNLEKGRLILDVVRRREKLKRERDRTACEWWSTVCKAALKDTSILEGGESEDEDKEIDAATAERLAMVASIIVNASSKDRALSYPGPASVEAEKQPVVSAPAAVTRRAAVVSKASTKSALPSKPIVSKKIPSMKVANIAPAVSWSPTEDKMLIKGVNKFGRGNWKAIRGMTSITRSSSQMNQRYMRLIRNGKVAPPEPPEPKERKHR